jgi:GNAT superfamily N-acetyltransferase
MAVVVRRIDADAETEAAVQAVHERATDYVLRLWGLPPDPNSGADFFARRPPGCAPENKHTLGIFDGDTMVGCIDLVRGWPDATTAAIGLLLLEPNARGRGIGRFAFEAIEAQAQAWPEITHLRALVIASNGVARPFWERMGFLANGQTRPHEMGTVKSTAIVLMRPLERR